MRLARLIAPLSHGNAVYDKNIPGNTGCTHCFVVFVCTTTLCTLCARFVRVEKTQPQHVRERDADAVADFVFIVCPCRTVNAICGLLAAHGSERIICAPTKSGLGRLPKPIMVAGRCAVSV